MSRLPPSSDRFALEAEIALARGDTTSAIAAELAAGDITGFQALTDRLAEHGQLDEALKLERRMVGRLQGDRTQRDAFTTMSFHLGRLEQCRAYSFPPGPKKHPVNYLFGIRKPTS